MDRKGRVSDSSATTSFNSHLTSRQRFGLLEIGYIVNSFPMPNEKNSHRKVVGG